MSAGGDDPLGGSPGGAPGGVASDDVVRVITDDGSLRVVAAGTTNTVRGIAEAQGVEGEDARELAELATGAVLVRATMAPQLRVQVILRESPSGASLIADAHPSGATRGLAFPAREHESTDPPQRTLTVIRTLQDQSLQQGVIPVPGGGTVSDAVMAYMQGSEQVTSVVAVGAVLEGRSVVRAGGVLLQLLPEVHADLLRTITERLLAYESIDQALRHSGLTPRALLDDVLRGVPFTEVGRETVRYECWCDRLRVLSALATLPETDIREMIADGKPLSICCDYCRKEYTVTTAELAGLARES